MKKTITLIFVSLCNISIAYSQQTCAKKLKIAQQTLEKRNNITSPLLEEIAESLDSCNTKSATILYVKALLTLRESKVPNYNKALNYFKESALAGHTKSKTYLGYFYKNGLGTNVNYNESLYWIKQAASEGDNNALYTLGYYYLKGLANLKPDYEKAVSYFTKSSHKMAKHWLAFCQYHGFGTDKDEQTATALLNNIVLPDNDDLLSYIESNTSNDLEEVNASENPILTNVFANSKNNIHYGIWLEKDWKNEVVLRKIPITITTTNVPNTLKLTIEENNYTLKVNSKGQLLTKNLAIKLSSPFTAPNTKEYITYSIKDFTLSKDAVTGMYNIACKVWIKEFKENGSPITISIYSKEALAKKIDNSFNVYPTIFNNQLKFSLEIEHKSTVSFSLYDLQNNVCKIKDFGNFKPGKHEFTLPTNEVSSKFYIGVLNVNGMTFKRQVIKKN